MVKSLTNPFEDRPTPLGSLLTAAGHRLSAELDASLQAAGFADIRASHAPVFMAVEPDGSTITELAGRTRMTKQAVGELVRYLSDRGYLDVSPDPEDRRVRRVRLSNRGWQAIRLGVKVIDEFDAWLEESIGHRRVEQLRATLARIADTDPTER